MGKPWLSQQMDTGREWNGKKETDRTGGLTQGVFLPELEISSSEEKEHCFYPKAGAYIT